jgi:hypothetical protein
MTSKQNRRDFLKTLSLSMGASCLSLTDLAAAPSPKVLMRHHTAKATSVIWLHMMGAPSQMDTFDYKPELNKRTGEKLSGADSKTGFFTTTGKCLGSPFKFKQHGESGAWVSEIFPELAKKVDDISFLYSYYSRSNNHTPALLEMYSGQFRQGFPTIGSWIDFALGSTNDSLPSFLVLHKKSKPRGGDPVWSPGFLPKIHQATALNGESDKLIEDLHRMKGMTEKQQRAQLDALKFLNKHHQDKRTEQSDLPARLESFELAYRMQSAAPEAFDIKSEPEYMKRMYGLDDDKTKLMGSQLLSARRLVERGVRFIQVFAGTQSSNDGSAPDVPWDGHNNIDTNHRASGYGVDKPIAALLTDLKSRGLLDSTLVICGGEFGRTSDSQGKYGRDHNPNALTMWLAGGGIKAGVKHGRTDDFGYKAVEDRVNCNDLHATILHQMGIDHKKLTYRHTGRDFRLTDVGGELIKSIMT